MKKKATRARKPMPMYFRMFMGCSIGILFSVFIFIGPCLHRLRFRSLPASCFRAFVVRAIHAERLFTVAQVRYRSASQAWRKGWKRGRHGYAGLPPNAGAGPGGGFGFSASAPCFLEAPLGAGDR